MDHDKRSESPESQDFLYTLEGEISFFRSIMRARPVGMHRHFHVLAMRSAILKDTGHLVSIEDIWNKLQSCYELDALETLDIEGYDSGSSNAPTPPTVLSPSPTENLYSHPHFRSEFALPADEFYANLISSRRMRVSASLPSSSPEPSASAPPSAPPTAVATKRRSRGKTKIEMAGLVAGDSDSSALTQESGDEMGQEHPSPSIITVTDGEQEEHEAEDAEMHEQSGAPSIVATKPTRGRGPKASKRSAPVTRTRASAPRLTKKKKR